MRKVLDVMLQLADALRNASALRQDNSRVSEEVSTTNLQRCIVA